VTVGHEQVPVVRCDVDPAWAQWLAVLGFDDGEIGLAREDRREQAPARGRHMQHDADRGGEVTRKPPDHSGDRIYAAG
jgi:hypothetical protein